MTLNGRKKIARTFHFDRGGSIGEFTSATNANGAVSYTANITKGVQLSLTDSGDRAFIHFNGKLLFPIDDLVSVEYLFRLESWATAADGVLGVGSAFNADPDAIQESAWFRIGGGNAGAAGGRTVYVETDDNVTNRDDIATGIVLANDDWNRARIEFKTNTQTVGPPGASKPGKSSLKFSISDASGCMRHIRPNVHMDMSAYSGGLQLIAGLRNQSTNSTSYLFIKEIIVEYNSPA